MASSINNSVMLQYFYKPRNPNALTLVGQGMAVTRRHSAETKTELRHRIMVETAQKFPASIPAREVYKRFEAALDDEDLVFDYSNSRHRMRAAEALQEAGFKHMRAGEGDSLLVRACRPPPC